MIFFTGYFDESGKVHHERQRVVTLGGFVARADQWRELHFKWSDLLYKNGLTELKCTNALRFRRPLSRKVSAIGEEARIEALLPFIQCARSLTDFGIVSAVDAEAFRRLDAGAKRKLKGDPYYMAFVSVMANIEKVIRDKYPRDHVEAGIIFDYDNESSPECLKMFAQLCTNFKPIRNRFASIGFGNSEHFAQLQVADLLAGVYRIEAEHRFFGSPCPLHALYEAFNVDAANVASVVGHLWKEEGLKQAARQKDPFGLSTM